MLPSIYCENFFLTSLSVQHRIFFTIVKTCYFKKYWNQSLITQSKVVEIGKHLQTQWPSVCLCLSIIKSSAPPSLTTPTHTISDKWLSISDLYWRMKNLPISSIGRPMQYLGVNNIQLPNIRNLSHTVIGKESATTNLKSGWLTCLKFNWRKQNSNQQNWRECRVIWRKLAIDPKWSIYLDLNGTGRFQRNVPFSNWFVAFLVELFLFANDDSANYWMRISGRHRLRSPLMVTFWGGGKCALSPMKRSNKTIATFSTTAAAPS